jgi:alpha/beta superfamily hydrolase
MTSTATRAVSFASGDLTLEGVLHLPADTPAPGAVVCHPHPQYGGDMDNNVVMAACETLVGQGIAALRFNFRGVGASQGVFDQGRGERDDVRAALAHLRATDEVDASRVALVGYSFGAMMAAEAASDQIQALVLISPPVAYSDLRVDWGCPTLALGSDSDPISPEDRLRVVGSRPGAEVHIVPGPDHSWWGFERELGDALCEFIGRQFA